MEHNNRFSFGQLGIGVFLLVIGSILMLDNFDIINTPSVWNFWPLILIIVGIGKLLDAHLPHEYQKAFWMLFLGTWFLISELHLFGLSYSNSWPILLIGVGIGMLWKSFYPEHINIVKDHCNGN